MRVALDDPNRGGVLGMAATLVLTSAPERTSPIRRGVWILDAMLGQRPPDPPPGIPPLEEAGPGRRPLTLRDQMELHRNEASCARCHDSIDPLGLALENFGTLGEWRERDKYGTIDASAVLPGGERIAGSAGLKATLLTKYREPFIRNVAERMLAYALGRAIQYSDPGRPSTARPQSSESHRLPVVGAHQGHRRQCPVPVPRGLRAVFPTPEAPMAKRVPPSPGRTLLRGMGAALALPWLEVMSPACASARASRKPPLRLGVLFKGNGVHPPSWDITGTSETDFALSPLLEPLAPLREKILILSNLAHREGGGSHHAAAVAFLSGAATPGSIDVPQPVTLDQLAASRLGRHTPLLSFSS